MQIQGSVAFVEFSLSVRMRMSFLVPWRFSRWFHNEVRCQRQDGYQKRLSKWFPLDLKGILHETYWGGIQELIRALDQNLFDDADTRTNFYGNYEINYQKP